MLSVYIVRPAAISRRRNAVQYAQEHVRGVKMKRKKLTRDEVIRLHDIEGKSFEEIAKPYKISRQAAHAMYHYQPVPRDDQHKRGPKGAS